MQTMVEKTCELCENVESLQNKATDTLIICNNEDKDASGKKDAKQTTQKIYEAQKINQETKLFQKQMKEVTKRYGLLRLKDCLSSN